MGILDRLFGGSSDLDHCPYCKNALVGFGCVTCNVEFEMENGSLVERGLSNRGGRTERRCDRCDSPMRSTSQFTAAWEDGDNEDAFITCPSCGHANHF